jgi:hypothetical protein
MNFKIPRKWSPPGEANHGKILGVKMFKGLINNTESK